MVGATGVIICPKDVISPYARMIHERFCCSRRSAALARDA